jgi:type I restriction enzyme S subunit
MGTVKDGVNGTVMRNMRIPLPPVAEQHRIVERVDQLMTICNELEAKIQANESTAQRFAEAVVAELAA